MGRALTIALVAVARSAQADPDVAVAASCGAVVDAATIENALRVELHESRARVYVECPTSDAVVVALGDTRTEVAVADVEVADRARVVALAVAEQLRPESEPPTMIATIEPADPPRLDRELTWRLAVRVDGLIANKAQAGLAGLALGRRVGGGLVQVEAAIDAVAGTSDAGRVVGFGGQAGVAVVPFRFKHSELGVAAALVGIGAWTHKMTGWDGAGTAVARGEVRLALDLGAPHWRALVAAGGGRALTGPDWFVTITIGAVVGL